MVFDGHEFTFTNSDVLSMTMSRSGDVTVDLTFPAFAQVAEVFNSGVYGWQTSPNGKVAIAAVTLRNRFLVRTELPVDAVVQLGGQVIQKWL